MSSKKRILVTGASGQLGQCLQEVAAAQGMSDLFLFASSTDLDITDPSAIATYFKQHQISYCINCAAYTAVDKAETEFERAKLINTTAVAYLAKACSAHHAVLIHISSDYVYHTNQNTPYKETDATKPKGVYAKTKLKGDLAVLKYHPSALVIRTSWVYSAYGANFVKTMLRVGATRPELSVVFDQIGTPTYAIHLAQAILQIISNSEASGAAPQGGIYHYSNEGITSWYDFAVAVFKQSNMAVKVLPIESVQYPTPAQRPHFSALNKAKIKRVFGIEIPHWEVGLTECLEALKQQS